MTRTAPSLLRRAGLGAALAAATLAAALAATPAEREIPDPPPPAPPAPLDTAGEQGAPGFSWTVRIPAGEISLRPGQSIPIGFAVGPVAATGVGLQFDSLVEEETRRLAGRGWQLCAERAPGACTTPVTLPANSVQQLYLRPADGLPLVGTYKGAVTIAAAEDLAGVTGTVTVHGTTDDHRIVGGVLIALSVVVAFAVSNVVQHAQARARMLQPAERLRSRLDRMRVRLDQALGETGGTAPGTLGLIEALKHQLSTAELRRRGLVPSRLPMPWSVGIEHTALEEALSTAGAWAGAVSLLITDGFDELAVLRGGGAGVGGGGGGGGGSDPVADAIDELDRIAAAALDASGVLRPAPDQALLAERIDAIVAAAGTAAGIAPRSARAGLPRRRSALEALQLEIGMLSVATWAVYLALTSTLGIYVMIYSDPGFGTLGDFLRCVFWGFGLPVGATILQQTPASVRTVLSISVPTRP